MVRAVGAASAGAKTVSLARSEVAAGAAAAVRQGREAAVGDGPGRRGTPPAGRAQRVPQQAAPAPAVPGPAAGEEQPRLVGRLPAAGHQCQKGSGVPGAWCEKHFGAVAFLSSVRLLEV